MNEIPNRTARPRIRFIASLATASVALSGMGPALAADDVGVKNRRDQVATLYLSKLQLQKGGSTSLEGGSLNYFCPADFSNPREEPGTTLQSSNQALEPCTNDRLLTHKGDVLRIVYVAKRGSADCSAIDKDVDAAIEEHARKTAAAAGFAAILKFAAQKSSGLEKADVPDLCYVSSEFRLVQDRGTVDVTVSLKSEPERKASKQLITGPSEHWFLSGDAVVKGVKELKYDPDKKAIFSRDAPEQLYLGINWMVGDVYGKYDALAMQRLVGKIMVLPSKRPFDSVGVGIGYRFVDGMFSSDVGLQATGGFMVFAGHFWTKNDEIDSAGALTQGGRSRSWRFGVSYGLDTLLGWLK